MTLFFLFLHFILSTLKFGENPYKILNVSSSATKQEIKSAFRKLTLQYHPDLNKKKDTTAKWVKINDAFELLNDPDRKARYDRTGSVSEEEVPIHPKENPFQDIDEHFIKMHKVVYVEPKTPLLSVLNFDDFVSQPLKSKRFSISYLDNEPEVESLIFIYSSVMCTACDIYLEIFEEFAQQFNSFVKCGRIDVSTSTQLAKDIGAKGIPSFVYYKKNLTSGKTVINSLLDPINSAQQISAFLISQWDLEIYLLNSVDQFSAFLNLYDKRTKIIEIVKYSSEKQNIQFDKFAGKYKEKALFAIIDHNNFSIAHQFEIRKFPAYLMFRNPEAEPLIFDSIESLTLGIENYQGPVMAELTRLNFPQMCGRNCLIRMGKAPLNVVYDLNYQYFPTFWISENSNAAKALGAKPNEWVEIDLDQNKYYIISQRGENETDTLKKSSSFNHNLDNRDLPANFNVDFQFQVLKTWIIVKVQSLIGRITFNMIDITITVAFFAYTGYNKLSDYLEKKKLTKAKDEKYQIKSNKKVDAKKLVQENLQKNKAANTVEEKPLTLDDYPID